MLSLPLFGFLLFFLWPLDLQLSITSFVSSDFSCPCIFLLAIVLFVLWFTAFNYTWYLHRLFWHSFYRTYLVWGGCWCPIDCQHLSNLSTISCFTLTINQYTDVLCSCLFTIRLIGKLDFIINITEILLTWH